MIPAILSCVFVVYMYQKLNFKTPASTSDGGVDDVDSLSNSRLANIESRLEQLAERIQG